MIAMAMFDSGAMEVGPPDGRPLVPHEREPAFPAVGGGIDAGVDGLGLEQEAIARAQHGQEDDINDPHLAAVLEASYAAQTQAGMQESEEDLIRQAIQLSKQEDER